MHSLPVPYPPVFDPGNKVCYEITPGEGDADQEIRIPIRLRRHKFKFFYEKYTLCM
jgi:hypothetical protein